MRNKISALKIAHQVELFPANTTKLQRKLSPQVTELLSKVSKAANILSQAMQKYGIDSETEEHKRLAAVEAFLGEIDSLTLCKIAEETENIPREVSEKIQALREYAEEALSFLIDKGHLEFIGAGTEGSVHRLRMNSQTGDTREFVVLKKSHLNQDGRIRHEFEMQEKAHIIAASTLGVNVPRPYMNFSKGNEHYMVMEYIRGKTLYTLQLEQVANKIVLERILVKLADPSIAEAIKIGVLRELQDMYSKPRDKNIDTSSPSTPLYGFFKRHEESNPIQFENDMVAEEKLMQLLQMGYQINAIEGDPMRKVLDPQFGVEVLELATKLYRENEKKFPLFSEVEATSASRSLRAFFDTIHNKGLYHRDFHPRNVIMGYDGNVHVIDFGYATVNSPDPYAEPGGGERIDDLNLINYISSQRVTKSTPHVDLLSPKLAKQQVILKDFDFHGLADITGMPPKDIELSVALRNHMLPPKALESQFNLLVSKKVGAAWEVYLKPRGQNMRTSSEAEARWAIALALLSDDEFNQFTTLIKISYEGMSITSKKRAASLLKKISAGAALVKNRNISVE